MRWTRILAFALFLGVFGVALVVQAPPTLVQRALGSSMPPVLALVAPDPAVAARGLAALGSAQSEARLTWRYDHFSFARLGPVYRVSLAGQGLTGKGRLLVTPIGRRLVLKDVRLTLTLPNVNDALREALFRPQGRADVTIDDLEVGLEPWQIDRLAGQARWEGARSELVPEIDFGAVEARLSAPEHNLIRAEIANRDGDVTLSGIVSLAMNEDLSVDLYLEPRPGTSDTLTHALGPIAVRENTGWRVRHTMATGGWD